MDEEKNIFSTNLKVSFVGNSQIDALSKKMAGMIWSQVTFMDYCSACYFSAVCKNRQVIASQNYMDFINNEVTILRNHPVTCLYPVSSASGIRNQTSSTETSRRAEKRSRVQVP